MGYAVLVKQLNNCTTFLNDKVLLVQVWLWLAKVPDNCYPATVTRTLAIHLLYQQELRKRPNSELDDLNRKVEGSDSTIGIVDFFIAC